MTAVITCQNLLAFLQPQLKGHIIDVPCCRPSLIGDVPQELISFVLSLLWVDIVSNYCWIIKNNFSLIILELIYPLTVKSHHAVHYIILLSWEDITLGMTNFTLYAEQICISVKNQRNTVKNLKRKSLWSKTMEEVTNRQPHYIKSPIWCICFDNF